MRTAALILLLAPMLAAPAAEFDQRLEAFNTPYALFYRAFHGCPAGATAVTDCKLQLAVVDRKQFERARAAAMRLFELREKNDR